MSPNEQFIIQMTTTLIGFIVTLVTLYLKHLDDMRERHNINEKVDHVSQAVNGVPGEPTVKEQTAIIQDTIRSEVIPKLQETKDSIQAQKEGC